jgi:hypothetical protein
MQLKITMKLKKIKIITITFVFILLIMLSFKNIVIRNIHNLAIIFSPDKEISNLTLSILFYLIIFDFFILHFIFFKHVFKINTFFRTIIYSFIIEIFFIQVIFLFDRRPIQNAYHSISFLNSIHLFFGGIFAYLISKHYINKKDIKLNFFWIISSFGLFFVSFDELFEIHEYVGGNILLPLLIRSNTGNWILSLVDHADDLIIILYFIGLIILLLTFFKLLIKNYIKKYKIYIFFVMGIVCQGLAIISEQKLYWHFEEYFEIFASFLYLLSLVLLKKNLEK